MQMTAEELKKLVDYIIDLRQEAYEEGYDACYGDKISMNEAQANQCVILDEIGNLVGVRF